MRFKTHAERNGELMFTEFPNEEAMHRAIAEVSNEDLLFDEISVFVEDGKGWKLIAVSRWLVDHPRKGTVVTDDLERWLDRAPVRWSLFSDHDCLAYAISRTFWA